MALSLNVTQMDKHGHVVGYRVTIINRDFEDSSDFK